MQANGKAWHRNCNLWREQNGLAYVDTPPTETLIVSTGVPTWSTFPSSLWEYMNLYTDIYLLFDCDDDPPTAMYRGALYCHASQNELTLSGLDRKLKFIGAFDIENHSGPLLNQILAGTLFADPTIPPVYNKFYNGCNISLLVTIGEPTTWPKFASSVNIRNT